MRAQDETIKLSDEVTNPKIILKSCYTGEKVYRLRLL